MSFEIPSELLAKDSFNGCPPGYIYKDGACFHPLTEDILEISEESQYDFKYYDNCGEVVGKYEFGKVGKTTLSPIYFAQNAKVDTPRSLEMYDNEVMISDEDGMLLVDFSFGPEGLILSENFYSDSPELKNTVYLGEFHLLTNNPSTIKNFGLSFELKDSLGRHISKWDDLRAQDPKNPTVSFGEPYSLVDFAFGYARIPNTDRPWDMIEESEAVTPTYKDPIYATDRITWKTLRETCFRWIYASDGDSFDDIDGDRDNRNGHYLMQCRARVIESKLLDFMTSMVDYSEWESNKDFRIVIYPPSLKIKPLDNVIKLISPRENFTNRSMREIVFEVPQNYKRDGNVQYSIDILTEESDKDILFRTSSYGNDPDFEEFQWHESDDGKSWRPITSSAPTFNNSYQEINGSDSELSKFIKYELSYRAQEKLKNLSNLKMRIGQIDGTRKVI